MSSFTPTLISEPELLQVPDFQTLHNDFKQFLTDYLTAQAPDNFDAEAINALLSNPSEPVSVILDALTVLIRHWQLQQNEQFKQMYALWAQGAMLEAKCLDFGIRRKPDESDEDLRSRYFLATYKRSAGTESAYIYHALTLGDVPTEEVSKSADGQRLTVSYQLSDSAMAANVLDASVLRQDNAGNIQVSLLLKPSASVATAEIIAFAQSYLNRNDIRGICDRVEVVLATLKPVTVKLVLDGLTGPEKALAKSRLTDEIHRYFSTLRLGDVVDREYISHLLYSSRLTAFEVVAPAADFVVGWNERAVLEKLQIDFKY